LEEFKKKFNAALAGIQGSGWAWLVKDSQTGNIAIQTYANQDPVVGRYKPLLGVDAWEHAVRMLKTFARPPTDISLVLPTISEPQGRVLHRCLGRHQLEGCREEVLQLGPFTSLDSVQLCTCSYTDTTLNNSDNVLFNVPSPSPMRSSLPPHR
jgi:hypothetical protein